MTLLTKICARALIHRCFTRTYSTCNVPKTGDRGMNFWKFIRDTDSQVLLLVVVGMSGGVDSSVSALLLAKNVCKKKVQHISNHFKTNLVNLLGFWPFCCFYAELGHSRRIWHRHGMRMGKRLARCSVSVQETWSSLWTCVCCCCCCCSLSSFCVFLKFLSF